MFAKNYKAEQHCPTFWEVERINSENNKRRTDAEKWQRFAMLQALAEKRLKADIAKRHPNIGEYEMKMRFASHRIPADLMRKAYGWDPELTDDRYDKENELEEQLRKAQLKDYEQRKQQAQNAQQKAR